MTALRPSRKASSFTESVIREMTRLAIAHDAINLSQGYPDFPAPMELKEAARQAIAEDINQYPITWGSFAFLEAIADKYRREYGMEVDPETMVCVTCGSTEAMIASMLGLLDPGDEVVLFSPFYENYCPDAILAGATPRYVTLSPPGWSFDREELAAAFTDRTRAIVINTPNNPTGKVFTREELEVIADLCLRHDVVVLTDEIYERILYDGHRHVPPATVQGLEDRTVTISALSKTYAVTGWRVGWTVAPPQLTAGIRAVHDFLTVAAAAPLQEAGVVALSLPEDFYRQQVQEYRDRRDLLMRILAETGFKAEAPQGAYYVMADVSHLGFADDVEAATRLTEDVGVAVVPGSSFFSRPELGRHLVRFAFCKRLETLEEAGRRLRAFLAV
ncbi:MAG TPA: aminotransferase class I/II-fold pyridoxal phosphate-dependent enzyme [Actinomycetota bacterium]|jgi:aminotransferase|nr:aminotransferase class I/II-fold pyridoxal phosphate-dependent enzyme [Actinomycetota bacterium]